jgi:hypothetical protein
LRVEEKSLGEDFLMTNENMLSTEPPLDALPDLAIPLPPAPGGEESA